MIEKGETKVQFELGDIVAVTASTVERRWRKKLDAVHVTPNA